MGKLLCEKNLRDVWCRNEGVRAEIGQILHTHASSSSSDTSAGQRFPPHNRTLGVGEFRVGGGVHDSYTFQCGLVGSFTSPGIDTR